MKSTGVVRKSDELGRIVLPIEIRKVLDIKQKDAVEIFTDDDKIILQKYQPSCIFCNNADDVVYFQTTANNGYSGTLEMALIPEGFKTDVLGETLSNGVYVEKSNVTPKEFALLFEFQGDEKATRHAIFRCSCTRPDVASATKEASIEPQTETLNITAMPRINDYAVKASCPQTTASTYTNWFSAVVTV